MSEYEFTTTRVTNPGADEMAKLTGAKKRAFLERMAKGRRAAARRRNPATKKRSTTRKRSTRRANPMKVAGVKVKPVAVQGLGIALGAYFGGTLTGILDRNVVSRFGGGYARALGFALSGIGTLVLGEWLQKKVKDFPITAAAAGATAPMWIAALTAARIMQPLGVQDGVAETAVTTAGRRRMRGSLQPGRIPGSMAGTIQPGGIPGSSMGRGAFGALLN